MTYSKREILSAIQNKGAMSMKWFTDMQFQADPECAMEILAELIEDGFVEMYEDEMGLGRDTSYKTLLKLTPKGKEEYNNPSL